MTSTWTGTVTWDATLTCWDVACLLGMPVGQVLRMTASGQLPATVVFPGVLRFKQVDVDQVRGRR